VPGCVAPVGQRAALALAAQVAQGPGRGLCLVPAGPAASARINALLLQLNGRCRRTQVCRVLCSRQLAHADEAAGGVRQTQTLTTAHALLLVGYSTDASLAIETRQDRHAGRHHPAALTASHLCIAASQTAPAAAAQQPPGKAGPALLPAGPPAHATASSHGAAPAAAQTPLRPPPADVQPAAAGRLHGGSSGRGGREPPCRVPPLLLPWQPPAAVAAMPLPPAEPARQVSVHMHVQGCLPRVAACCC
jgi:hypothetical protein